MFEGEEGFSMSRVRRIEEPPMYATEKLEEALYFVLQMRRSYVDRTDFVHNMNAFLNSARNVTFVLQEDFAHMPSLKAWYLEKRKEMERDKLMKFFIKMRNVSLKERTPKHSLSIKWAYIIPKNERTDIFGYSESKVAGEQKDTEARLVMPTFDEAGMHSKPKFIEPVYSLVTLWEFDKTPEGYEGNDILGLCVEYYHKLERLINEAKLQLTKVVWRKEE
jgi:hypothetical protein